MQDRWRGIPRSVRAVTALFGALLLAYSLLTPLGEAPDEGAHADLVLHLATGAPYPSYDGRNLGQAVQFGSHTYRPRSGRRVLTPDDAPSRTERRDFEDFGGDRAGNTPNSSLQHPPLYYRLASLVLRAERFLLPGAGLPPLDREWSLLRLLSVLMAVPLPILAWASARRIGAAEPVAIAASLVPLAIPQLLHNGSTITNDGLFNLCAAVLAFFLAGVLRGDRSVRTAVFVGLALGAALLTKAFGTVLVPWVAIAYVVGLRRDRSVRPTAFALGVAGLTALVLSGWWWLRNVIRYGKLSPTPTDATVKIPSPGFEPSVTEWAGSFGPWIVERFWGWFGYFSVRLDLPVIVLASVVTVVGLVAGLLPRRSEERVHPTPLESATFLLPLAGLLVFVAVRSFSRYRETSLPAFIQGRYLFGALIPLAVVVAAGLHRVSRRWAIPALAGLALVMQVDAVRVMLRDWWAEPGAGLGRRIDAVLAWGPWPVGVPYLVALAVVATAAWTTFELGALSRRE